MKKIFQKISFFFRGKEKYIFLVLIIILIFSLNLKPPRDPDLGWHLKTGEYILETKTFPHQDPFSYTTAEVEWAPHEWLNDVIMFFIYDKGGLFALSLIFALITAATFFIVSIIIKAKIEYCLLAALFGSLASGPIIGIRAQVFTLLGLAILLFILFRFRANQDTPHQNLVWGLPLLFLIWANLHGGFIVGFFAFLLFLFFEGAKIAYLWLKKKSFRTILIPQRIQKISNFLRKWFKKIFAKNELIKESLSPRSWLKLSGIALFSFGAVFINPYGSKLIYNLLSLFKTEHTYGRGQISEWQPVAIQDLMSWDFLMYLALLAILALIYFRKIDLTLLGSGIVFSFLAFSAWRNMPLLIIMTTPLWVYIVKHAADPILSKMLKQKIILLLLLIATGVIGYQQISWAWTTSTKPEVLAKGWWYPKGAVEYIKTNPEKFQGNMFNEYNWGGYLIWQLPEKKVFIDGRMMTIEIFKEFHDVKGINNPGKVIEKYNIEWMLLYKNSLTEYYLSYQGWEKVYGDDISVIYLKKQ